MSLIYKWVGHFGILMAAFAGISLFVALMQGGSSEARNLKSIEAGVFWVLAMVAYGNVDRREAAARRAECAE